MRVLAGALRAAWLAVAGLAAAAHAQTGPRAPRIEAERYVLANGLRVVLSPSRTAPVVAVNLRYHVGSRDEVAGRTGFAHLFEHMMLQGSARVARGEHSRLVERAGGGSDARTTEDFTEYYEVLPAGRLNLALWLEADRMAALQVTQASLDTQREVVLEERRLRVENQPYAAAILAATEALFGPGCFAYGHPLMGVESDLRAATLQDVRAFFATYYVPRNATLVVTGDFDPAVARRLIQGYFGAIPGGAAPPPSRCDTPFATLPLRQELTDDKARLAGVLLSFAAPPARHDDAPALELLGIVLGQGEGSRLHRRLVRDEQAAVVAQTSFVPRDGPGAFQITVATPDDPARAQTLLDEELRRVAEAGVDDAELRRARLRRQMRVLTEAQTVFGRAQYLQSLDRIHPGPDAARADFERYERVRPEDLRRVAARYLVPARRVVTVVRPPR